MRAVMTQAQKGENDAGRRLALGIEMAQVAESSPGGLDKAIDIWKSVLKLQPGHGEASAALKRLYTRTEKWNALLEMLKEQAESLFQNYLDHAEGYVTKKKLKDRSTGEELTPDEGFMKSIEEQIAIIGTAADGFRQEVISYLWSVGRRGGNISYES